MKDIKKCVICGKEFAAYTRLQVCCSKECGKKQYKLKHRLPMLKHTCPVCGKEFEHPRTNKVTCSKECADKWVEISKARKRKKLNRVFPKNKKRMDNKGRERELEYMKKNNIPVSTRRDTNTGMTIESRGQYCWSGGLPSLPIQI